MHGNIDVWDDRLATGWAADKAAPDRTEIVVLIADGKQVLEVAADRDRPDLAEAGFGPLHGFQLEYDGLLPVTATFLEIIVKRTGHSLGVKALVSPELLSPQYAERLSKERWLGEEDDPHLTWGKIMTGDSFVDAIDAEFASRRDMRVLEVGPGYGRLLRTIVRRDFPFKEYLGIDLSAARVSKLTARFGTPNIRFERADVTQFEPTQKFDLILCSSTMEHLYPSCLDAMRKLSTCASDGALLALDFIDPISVDAAQTFHADQGNGYFVRVYSEDELSQLHNASGLQIAARHKIVIGKGSDGDVRRLLCLSRAAR